MLLVLEATCFQQQVGLKFNNYLYWLKLMPTINFDFLWTVFVCFYDLLKFESSKSMYLCV